MGGWALAVQVLVRKEPHPSRDSHVLTDIHARLYTLIHMHIHIHADIQIYRYIQIHRHTHRRFYINTHTHI